MPELFRFTRRGKDRGFVAFFTAMGVAHTEDVDGIEDSERVRDEQCDKPWLPVIFRCAPERCALPGKAPYHEGDNESARVHWNS